MASEHREAEPIPLGLKLNIDDLLKKIQKEFDQDIRAKGRYEPTVACPNVPDTRSSTTTRPLKPSKFHAHILRIGTWQWTSRYGGDLVAKFYYANDRLVWEILVEGLKRKIEINLDDIAALKITCPDGGPGTLEITLFKKPRFFREINQQPRKNTMWQGTIDFTGGQASIYRKHVLQCAPEILKKHIAKLLSSNDRLYSLSQEGTVVQLNPYFGHWHSDSQVPTSSNVHDLHLYYGTYQRFWGHKIGEVPISVGTSIDEISNNGSHDMSILYSNSASGRSLVPTGAPSSGLEQHRNMFNRCSTLLQKRPQNPYLEQWCSEPEILESSSAQDFYHHNNYQHFVGLQFREAVPMSIEINIIERNHNGLQDGIPRLTPYSDLGHSSAVTGGPSASGGLEQHRNMFDWSRDSFETLCQAQLNFSNDTSSGGLQLQHHRNMFNSSSSSFQTPPHQAQLNISSGSRIMDDDANYMVNPWKQPNLLASMGASAHSHAPLEEEDVWEVVKDNRSASSPRFTQNYSVGSSSQSMRELELGHNAFSNTTTTQIFQQQVSSGTMDAMVLEKISHDLLDDIDVEPTGEDEEAMVVSTIDSLSSLLQEAPATGESSQASNAHAGEAAAIAPPLNVPAEAAATQLLDVDPDAGSSSGAGSGSNNSFLPSAPPLMAGKPWEQEPMVGIDMDLAYLSESPPFFYP